MSTKSNLPIGNLLRQLRERNGLPLRKVAAFLDIDQSYLSKIERGQKLPTKKQLVRLAHLFKVDKVDLLLSYLSDKILYELKGEDLAQNALRVAEKKLLYESRNGRQNLQ